MTAEPGSVFNVSKRRGVSLGLLGTVEANLASLADGG